MSNPLISRLQSIADVAEYLHKSLADPDSGGSVRSPGRAAEASEKAIFLLKHGAPLTPQDLPAWLDAANSTTDGMDDRKLLLEDAVKFMSRLPPGNAVATWLEHQFIDLLYKDLPHPPSGYLSTPHIQQLSQPFSVGQDIPGVLPIKRIRYASRSDDGSGYNPLFPTLGKAGEPYARSVPSLHSAPGANLPDAGLLFDTLLKRDEDKFTPHPSGFSSLFFSFANLIIHTCFNTNYSDQTLNDNSSYLDLSPLYGGGPSHFVKPVEKMRVFDGTGKIWADTFADGRLLFMPPATAAILILFNRNHNFICDKLLNVNEQRTFKNPQSISDEAEKKKQDDEIFARARLVNCGFFMQVILQDYVGSILGLERDGLTWRLNPLEDTRQLSHEVSPRGEGNVCSIEFNLLYRWHASTSQPDAAWTANKFKELFPGKEYDEVTTDDFKQAARQNLRPPEEVRTWTFGDLKRVPDEAGVFADADIANVLQNATQTIAASFQARGSPEWMRVIEVLSIEQAREWGTCTLNEFRKFIGLKPLVSFKQWNPDPTVWKVAERLYKDIDNLELYVGMQAEEVKKPMPGAGLCPGYTISRAILGDAVALTRGDPYLTTAMTPYNFTSWGYQDCQPDVEDGAYGGMMTRLLLRHLPQHYGSASALALFPFQEPERMHKYMKSEHDIDRSSEYNWNRLNTPISLHVIDTYSGVKHVLSQPQIFEPVGRGSAALFHPNFEASSKKADSSPVKTALFRDLEKWKSTVEGLATKLSRVMSIQHSQRHQVKYLDIVDLVNILPCYLIADNMVGLPLKTASNPAGVWTPREMHKKLANIADYSFINSDLSNEWSLRQKATKAVEEFAEPIQRHFDSMEGGRLSVASVADGLLHATTTMNDHSGDFLAHVFHSHGRQHPKDLTRAVIEEILTSSAIWSATIASVLEYYLEDSRKDDRMGLAHATDEQMLVAINEALRLNPPFTAIPRRARKQADVDGQVIDAGGQVLLSLGAANTSTDQSSVPLFNICNHGLMTEAVFESTAPVVVRILLSLPGLQRAPGNSGHIHKFTQQVHGIDQTVFVDDDGKHTPFPASFMVQHIADE